MRTPPCSRDSVHATVSSSSRRIAPTQRAAMWMRSSTNHMFCSSAPLPIISSPPSTASAGTSTSNRMRRVAVRVVVRERRIFEERDAGDAAVDQEQRRQPVVAVDDVDHDDVVVGHVAGGDEPLLGLDAEAGVGAHRGAGDAVRVGARVALGDGVGVGALAAQARLEVALDLLGRAEAEHVVGAGPAPPDGVRVAAELLVHDHLVDHRHLGAAVDLQVTGADHAGRERGVEHAPLVVGVEAVQLGLQLERDADVVDVGGGATAQVLLRGREGEVHAYSLMPRVPSTSP